MILVLLTRFCESENMDFGYKLCQVLVKQGHDLFVTSVSTGKALEAETKDAKELSIKEKGTITLLHPDDEDPQPEWLTKHHKKYFSYLSKLRTVDVIIGTLPGSEITASELAATLKSRLILLASAKLQTDPGELKKVLEKVDELWSIGPDNFNQNNAVLHKVSPSTCQKHKEISLHPPHLTSNLLPSLASAEAAGPNTGELPTFSETPESVKVQAWLQSTEEPKYAEEDLPLRNDDCPLHSRPIWYFCTECEEWLCCFCFLHKHSDHSTIDLHNKGFMVQHALQSLLHTCKRIEDEILKRTNVINNNKEDVENCASTAMKQMTEQYEKVQELFKKQIVKIKQWKEDQLKAFEKEAEHLNHIDKQGKNIADIGGRLLKQNISPSYISQCDNFLKLNPLKYLSTPPITPYEPVVYREPFFYSTKDSQQLQRYMEEYMLGYFSPDTSVTGKCFRNANIRHFEESHLKIFFSALFLRDSLWVTGWHGTDNVFLNLDTRDMSIITKQNKGDPEAKSETVMCLFGDYILYAKKGGSEVHSFHTQSHAFKRVYSRLLCVAAMCSSDHHVFILNRGLFLSSVIILNDNFQTERVINAGLTHKCNFDICVLKSNFSGTRTEISHTIVISSSVPNPFVRAINKTQGVLWQLDCRSNPRLDLGFNPCSISASEDGDIFIADQGINKIYKVSGNGKDLTSVLSWHDIFNPTVVRVDTEGRRLVVVNGNGKQIQVYELTKMRDTVRN